MKTIALLGGTVFLDHEVFDGGEWQCVNSGFGEAEILVKEGLIFLPRHGRHSNRPPHTINHQANMKALKDRGVSHVVAVNSTGSLSTEYPPGSLVIPEDYINLWDEKTFFNDSLTHITPFLDESLRQALLDAASRCGIEVIKGGVYMQTRGPRLETKAEVRMLRNYADIIGMTLGSEASAAREIGLGYAGICSVYNYAHGLTGGSLSADDISAKAGRSAENMKAIFFEFLKKEQAL